MAEFGGFFKSESFFVCEEVGKEMVVKTLKTKLIKHHVSECAQLHKLFLEVPAY